MTQIVDGDCGSWVIDFESGDLLGHLVSGYSETGIGYIMPAEQIFRNISGRFDSPVQLSTRARRATRGAAKPQLSTGSRRAARGVIKPQPTTELSGASGAKLIDLYSANNVNA